MLLYGAKTWALGKEEERLLDRTEMKMLRWIRNISLRERLRNEEMRRSDVTHIVEKAREARLR